MTMQNIAARQPETRRQPAEPARVDLPEANHELTVILPAFNEEQRLPWSLCQLGMFLDQWGIDYRVVVADDGSTDRTAQLAGALGPRFSTIRVAEHRGKGCAVRTAMLRATGRVVAFTDADLPFELTALREGYQWIHKGTCEVVFGARDIAGARHVARRRLSRTIATAGFRQIVKCLISREVGDTQCGLKLFGRRAACEIFSRATIDGFAFDAEVVFLTRRLRLPFRRVPVNLIHDYDSTLSLRRHALPMLWDVIRLRLRDWLGQRRVTPLEIPRQDAERPAASPAEEEQRKLAA
jgi:dolichyl-phosphate beta-glucosyltransferase